MFQYAVGELRLHANLLDGEVVDTHRRAMTPAPRVHIRRFAVVAEHRVVVVVPRKEVEGLLFLFEFVVEREKVVICFDTRCECIGRYPLFGRDGAFAHRDIVLRDRRCIA